VDDWTDNRQQTTDHSIWTSRAAEWLIKKSPFTVKILVTGHVYKPEIILFGHFVEN
jgi:hypothetical protein